MMKIPVFLTVHDITPHTGEGKLIAEISTRCSLWVSRIAFVHGEKLKRRLAERGFSEEKIMVIPHGDYSFLTRILPEDHSTRENITILFFGRILDYKGLEYLIKAEPEITRTIPDLKIIIAGQGDFSKYERMIVNRDRFEIINKFIPDEGIPPLFSRASIIVLPYIEASQTGIIPIAYAFAKPVVTTDVGSIPEIVENGITGIIIPPHNVTALSDAIIHLITHKELAEKMGLAGQDYMHKRMSWDAISQNIFDKYKKIMYGEL
jgi:glycosyltransferase involved in cell wall biosynthesis